MDYPPPRPPGMGMPPGGGYGMPHPPYGMIPPPGMPPMMPPRPPYAAQADARLRMPGMRGDMPPPMSAIGPPVTVFVGNITEKAQDSMIRQLLNTSGHVNSWKRVQGATGKLQAFGFCEYANPDAALRAIRLLHDWEVADKKLVVKVDAKTKDVLEDFKKKKRKALLGEEKEKQADQDHVKESEYVDPAMKKEDETTKERIKTIIKDHSKDMNAYISSSGEKRSRRPHGHGLVNNDGEVRLTGPKESLEDVELEAGKRDIINREIGKFRETMKIREKEKEEEKKKREKELGSGGEENSSSSRKSKDRDRSDRDRDRGDRGDRESQDRRRERDRESKRRTRSPSPDRNNKRENRSRSDRGSNRGAVSRSRSRSRERRSRSRRDSPAARERRDPKDVRRERELEEESKDRSRAERKASEKERSYQERLKKWETRENKMARQYENDKQKEVRKKEDEEREALKLREFLEDYDDDKNDEKYYKGSRLDRRMAEREREAAKDSEDRAHEKEEIEELRVKILNEGHADPNAELERRMAELEGRKLVEFVDLGVSPPQDNDEAPIIMDDHIVPEVIPMDEDSVSPAANIQISPDIQMDHHRDKTPTTTPNTTGTGNLGNNVNTINLMAAASNNKPASFIQIQPKKKIDVKDVFNQDDDETGPAKKKKLPPLSLAASTNTAAANSAAAAAAAANSADTKKQKSSDEDKRKHIKSLIEKIPTDKAALFEYRIDWDFVDNQLMEKRIRPWVNKKIAEYIGEPEPTLTDFICSKVLAGSTPKSVLDDVQMVLDEEAEVFVVKMWRLLIYEIENKKLKAASQQQTGSNA